MKNNAVSCPPCGENVALATKRGFLNKDAFMDNPPSVLRTTSPAQGGKETSQGFTLIELLVVVLIIGILAAVAVPQYQKAVEKSRATQVLSLFKSVVAATKAYYLANGDWPTSFSQLEVDIPWTGNTALRTGAKDTRSNGDWSLQLMKDTEEGTAKSVGISIGRISGPYKGIGFMYYNSYAYPAKYLDQIFCQEYINSVTTPYTGSSMNGTYCKKIIGGTYSHHNGHAYVFNLPY